MKTYQLFLPLMLLTPAMGLAQTVSPETVFDTNLASMICDSETDFTDKAYRYAYADVDGDGINEFVVADAQYLRCAYKAVNGQVHLLSTQVSKDLNWHMVSQYYLLSDIDHSHDITLRHKPMFCNEATISDNRFVVTGSIAWTFDHAEDAAVYDRMIFKPHVGNARFVNAQLTDEGPYYTFALADRTMTKKMFRGYTDAQAVPIVVPHAFLNSHTPLQFSRWLDGEKKVMASADVRNIISQAFPGQRIAKAQWMATCPINERSFYFVTFAPKNGQMLAAMVCIAEGMVVSSWNQWNVVGDDGDTLDNGLFIDDYFHFMPEIMAMMATEEGLELYMRWHSLEGIHYSIMREIGDLWLFIEDNYQYLMAF